MNKPRTMSENVTIVSLCEHMAKNELDLIQGVCDVFYNPVIGGRVDCDGQMQRYKVTIERI